MGGGSIALSEYGAKAGAPIFFCHGWPSSRTMAELTDTAARDLDLRDHFARPPWHSRFVFSSGTKTCSIGRRSLADGRQLGIGQFRIIGNLGRGALRVGRGLGDAGARPRDRGGERRAAARGAGRIARTLLPLYRWLLYFYPRHRELLRAMHFTRVASFSFDQSCRSVSAPRPAQTASAVRRQR